MECSYGTIRNHKSVQLSVFSTHSIFNLLGSNTPRTSHMDSRGRHHLYPYRHIYSPARPPFPHQEITTQYPLEMQREVSNYLSLHFLLSIFFTLRCLLPSLYRKRFLRLYHYLLSEHIPLPLHKSREVVKFDYDILEDASLLFPHYHHCVPILFHA